MNDDLTPRIRYLPVAVLALALMRNKLYWGSSIRAAGRRAVALMRRAKRRFFLRSQQASDTHELKTEVQRGTDVLALQDVEIRFGRSLTTT